MELAAIIFALLLGLAALCAAASWGDYLNKKAELEDKRLRDDK